MEEANLSYFFWLSMISLAVAFFLIIALAWYYNKFIAE